MTSDLSHVSYDYAVIRLVPCVHRGAFENVGVVLHARREGYVDLGYALDAGRIARLTSAIDLTLVDRHLDAWQRIARGAPSGGIVALLPPSERFHWLTSPRSTMIQTSPVHPGRCTNPEEALERLLSAYVLGTHR